ncbi:Fic family protein [Saccharothrix sp. NPDC042600]|uniref:Fic/DOC family protein n=1 Tax=Saccharothrix TaxID=2071 RepID=UPI0033DE3AB2|nr:Fic family protein [Saccharothrix mutabilis subsp. capreolus]
MTSADPYTDPTTGVLRNHFGLTDRAECDRAEARLSALRLGELAITPLPGLYDLAHLRKFHRHIFGDLYPWAGEVRRVNITKTATFAAWQQIEPYAHWLFGELKKEQYLRDLAGPAFLDRFTHYFAEVNALHPFREGNGRTQRAFFGQLALEAGWVVGFGSLEPVAFGSACRESMSGSSAPLRGLLAEVTRPARAQ